MIFQGFLVLLRNILGERGRDLLSTVTIGDEEVVKKLTILRYIKCGLRIINRKNNSNE